MQVTRANLRAVVYWGPIKEKNRPNKKKIRTKQSRCVAIDSSTVTQDQDLLAQGSLLRPDGFRFGVPLRHRRLAINDLCILAGILALIKARGAARLKKNLYPEEPIWLESVGSAF